MHSSSANRRKRECKCQTLLRQRHHVTQAGTVELSVMHCLGIYGQENHRLFCWLWKLAVPQWFTCELMKQLKR